MSTIENRSLPKSGSNNLYEDGSDELRRGPWTTEEDNLLRQYIDSHGEGRWNSLAEFAGLKRTGKSCRLRWLNYLKPDVKRGNLTPQEQLLILELHSEWGNRWSKIAQQLPGRTDNEIKNYWRTRVQKQARKLKIDSNSKKFVEAIRRFWTPRLLEKMKQDLSEQTEKASSPPPTFNQPKHSPIPSDYMASDHEVSFGNSTNGEISGEYTTIRDIDSYQYEIPYYDMPALELYEDVVYSSGCHVADDDWFVDDDWFIDNGSFRDTDELWQFRKHGV